MSALVPAAADAVLSEAEMALCLRHYVTDKPKRPWIAEGDIAPDLVWGIHEAAAPHSARPLRVSPASTATPLPDSNPRWRDQYLKLHVPKPAETPAEKPPQRTAAAPSADPPYVLISEDEEDEHLSSASPSQQPPAATSPRTDVATTSGRRGQHTTSPSPRRSAGGVSVSPTSRASQRHSTGSSVVYISQPTKKVVEADAEKARKGHRSLTPSNSQGQEHDGNIEMGKKRQRSMEEFLYRGA